MSLFLQMIKKSMQNKNLLHSKEIKVFNQSTKPKQSFKPPAIYSFATLHFSSLSGLAINWIYIDFRLILI